MLKIVGAVIVVSCCAFIGVGFSSGFKARVRSLNAILAALHIMKSEICDLLTPMPELLEMLTRDSSGGVRLFFVKILALMRSEEAESFSECWQRAARETPEMQLAPEDVLVICELSASLGRYDIEEQRTAIQRVEARLESHLKNAEEEKRNKGRVCTAMGVSAGLMLAIIMI